MQRRKGYKEGSLDDDDSWLATDWSRSVWNGRVRFGQNVVIGKTFDTQIYLNTGYEKMRGQWTKAVCNWWWSIGQRDLVMGLMASRMMNHHRFFACDDPRV